jgi:peroxiredoxin
MTKDRRVIAGLVFASILVAGWWVWPAALHMAATAILESKALKASRAAPDFTLQDANGKPVRLSDFKGKVVLLNFWATWCGPCTTETPQFDSVYRANKAKGVDFIGIDTKETSTDAAKAFVHDNDISYPIVSDEQGETAVALGKIPALALPFTVILDKQQRVAAVYLHPLTPKDLQPVLDKLRAES